MRPYAQGVGVPHPSRLRKPRSDSWLWVPCAPTLVRLSLTTDLDSLNVLCACAQVSPMLMSIIYHAAYR